MRERPKFVIKPGPLILSKPYCLERAINLSCQKNFWDMIVKSKKWFLCEIIAFLYLKNKVSVDRIIHLVGPPILGLVKWAIERLRLKTIFNTESDKN